MKSLRQGWALVVLFVGVSVLFPLTAQASFELTLTSFQTEVSAGVTYTGEIYASYADPSLLISNYTYCIDRHTIVYVPGTYTGELIGLATTGQQEAAWIMDNFAFSKHGDYGSLSDAGTGAAVQLAIWFAIGQATQTEIDNSPYKSAINYFLTAANDASPKWAAVAANYRYLDVVDSSGNHVQGQIVVANPIPGTVWLLGPGVLGLLAFRKRLPA